MVGNAAELRVQGIEPEGQFLLTDTLELGGNLNYLDHEYQSYPGAPCTVGQLAADPGCQNDFAGKRGPFAPEYSAVVYLDYNRDIANWLFNAHIDVAYKGEMYLDGDLDENALQDAYTKIDASVGLSSSDGRWDLVLYGRNLTDEATYTASVDAPLSAGIYAAWIEEPRIIGIQARYNF